MQTQTTTQPLAHIWLKTDVIGNNIPKKFVTPTEVMFLVADNHVNAGGDPVVSLKEVPDDAEAKPIAELKAKLLKEQEYLDALDNEELTDEIRERRTTAANNRMQAAQAKLDELETRRSLRFLTAGEERKRLIQAYGAKKVNHLFPGSLPVLPNSFKEARETGLEADLPEQRMVGNHPDEK